MQVPWNRRCARLALQWVAMLGAGAAHAQGNIVPIEVRQMRIGQLNQPLVDVTVCNAAQQCRIVPNVLLDTGSSGLHLARDTLAGLQLDPVLDLEGRPLAQAAYFGSGGLWGTLHSAQVRLGDVTTTQAIPIQLYDAPRLFERLPAEYRKHDARKRFLKMANGILGVSPWRYSPGDYFALRASDDIDLDSDWVSVQIDTTRQMANPIAHFPAPYNNGSVIQLPQVDWFNGQEQVQGRLGLGIGPSTEALFPPGARRISHELDPYSEFPAQLGGRSIRVLVDSGNTALSFDLEPHGIPSPAPDDPYFDPPALTPLALTVISEGKEIALSRPLYIGPSDHVLKTWSHGYAVLPMLVTKPKSKYGTQVLGLPFFYGRTVATGLHGTVNPLRGAAQAAPDNQGSLSLDDDGASLGDAQMHSLTLDSDDGPVAAESAVQSLVAVGEGTGGHAAPELASESAELAVQDAAFGGPAPSPYGFVVYTD